MNGRKHRECLYKINSGAFFGEPGLPRSGMRPLWGPPDREILHLLNFDGAAHDSWVDKGLAQTVPKIMRQVTVSHHCTKVPSKIWIASPDWEDGIGREVPFTQENGTVLFRQILVYIPFFPEYNKKLNISEVQELADPARSVRRRGHHAYL